MDVSIVYAVIEWKINEKMGRCQIIAYKNNEKRLITDEKKVTEVFESTSVFVSKELENFNLYELVEIKFTGLIPVEKESTKLPTILFSSIKLSNASLLVEIHEPTISDGFLELSYLRDKISRGNELMVRNKKFYLSFGNSFVGPFKLNNGAIVPFSNTTAGFYSMDDVEVLEYPNLDNVKFEDLLLLLDFPKPVNYIDCCTENQLIEWLKSKLVSGHEDRKVAELLNRYKSTFRYDSLNDNIEKSRYRRIEKILRSLELGNKEL